MSKIQQILKEFNYYKGLRNNWSEQELENMFQLIAKKYLKNN